MGETLKIILGSSALTSFITGVISFLFHRRRERVSAEIKREFEILSRIHSTDFEWKRESTKVLGQIYIHLNRTTLAFKNTYSKLKQYERFFEDEIMYTSNKKIRDMIIENGHYIPPGLLEEASKLVEHYDAWLVKYNTIRNDRNDRKTIHIYVGPDGFDFPTEAEEKFKQEYMKLFLQITQHDTAVDTTLGQ